MTMLDGFFFVDEAVPGIRWDAKYATWDNFTGRPVDGYEANRVVGSAAMCAALERARDGASALGLGLLIWDAYRPQRAVERFLRWAQEPEDGLTRERYYPNLTRLEIVSLGYVATRSGHSRGSSVDLTLFESATGSLLPMGGGHDLMDPISHHGAAAVGESEAESRRLLSSIMDIAGFEPFATEWWHYSLVDEPYPVTYFDFPVA